MMQLSFAKWALLSLLLLGILVTLPVVSAEELQDGLPKVSNQNQQHHRGAEDDEDTDDGLGDLECSPDAEGDECGDPIDDTAKTLKKMVRERTKKYNHLHGKGGQDDGGDDSNAPRPQNVIMQNDNKIHSSVRHYVRRPTKLVQKKRNIVTVPSPEVIDPSAGGTPEEMAPVEKVAMDMPADTTSDKKPRATLKREEPPDDDVVVIPKGIPARKPRHKIFIDTAQSTLFCIQGKPIRSTLLHPYALHTPAWCPHDNGHCCEKSMHCCSDNTICVDQECVTQADLDARLRAREQEAKRRAEELEKQLQEQTSKQLEAQQKEQAEKLAAEQAAKRAEQRAKKAEQKEKEAHRKTLKAEQAAKKHLRRTQEKRAKENLAKKRANENRKESEAKKKKAALAGESEQKKKQADRARKSMSGQVTELEQKTKQEEREKKLAAANNAEEMRKQAMDEEAKKAGSEAKSKKYFKPRKNMLWTKASKLKTGSKKYTFMFWVKPLKILPRWGQMLHKGEHRRDRGIAVWFIPKTTQLHVRSGSSLGWNTGVNTRALDMNRWTHVAITHQDRALRVYFDGELVRSRSIPPPTENTGDLWTCAPWYDPADCYMADVVYHNRILSLEEIKEQVGKEAYK